MRHPEKTTPAHWTETLDLHRVPWINDPSFELLKKTFGEHFSLWFIGEEDPQQLEQHRRFMRSMGLYPDGGLVHQSVIVNLGGGEKEVWNAAEFFKTMSPEKFMEGPSAKGWYEWCRERSAEMEYQVRKFKRDYDEGLYDGAGAG